ncbi:hypothetical protein D3C86_1746400 [compost metagenome]
MIPSWKIATSVVPPPISTKTTPAFFSSSSNTASDDAKGSRIHLLIFRISVTRPEIIWKFASMRRPAIPIGSRIPGSLSIVNSCGNTWIISSPGGNTNLYISEIRRSISFLVTSSSLSVLVKIPRC